MAPSTTLFTILISLFFHNTTSEIVGCNGDCSCQSNVNFGPDEVCTLNCGFQDSCKGRTLTCAPGRPCEVICSAISSCADITQISASTATDVTVKCTTTDSCKSQLTVICGFGKCNLQCDNPTACEDMITPITTTASSFQCTNCPSNIAQLQFTTNPTTIPTISPTISSNPPSINPSQSPTNNPSYITYNPSITPTKTPTNIPTTSPTINPSTNPSISPSYNPTIEPTLYPTFEPTIEPTYVPTIEPTTAYPTTNLPSKYPTGDPTTNMPSKYPTRYPTVNPSVFPTNDPTIEPTTNNPTVYVTDYPSTNPIESGSVVSSTSTNDISTSVTIPVIMNTKGINEFVVKNRESNGILVPVLVTILSVGVFALVVLFIVLWKKKKRVDSEKILDNDAVMDEENINILQTESSENAKESSKENNKEIKTNGDELIEITEQEGKLNVFYTLNFHYNQDQFEYVLKGSELGGTVSGWNENTFDELRGAVKDYFNIKHNNFQLYELATDDCPVDIDDIDDIIASFEDANHSNIKSIDVYVTIENVKVENEDEMALIDK